MTTCGAGDSSTDRQQRQADRPPATTAASWRRQRRAMPRPRAVGPVGRQRSRRRPLRVRDHVHVDAAAALRMTRFDDRAARPAGCQRLWPLGPEHELRGVLGRGEVDEGVGHVARRRPRGRCRRARRGGALLRSSVGAGAGRGGRRRCATWTPISSPWSRPAMRAARRISCSPPGAPVMATTTRSRVSHGVGDAVAFMVALQAFVDPVGEPQQRELAQGGEVAGAEVVGQRGVDASRAGRCCRGPCAGGAPRGSCRPARSGRRGGRRRRGPSPLLRCR